MHLKFTLVTPTLPQTFFLKIALLHHFAFVAVHCSDINLNPQFPLNGKWSVAFSIFWTVLAFSVVTMKPVGRGGDRGTPFVITDSARGRYTSASVSPCCLFKLLIK